MDRNEAAWGRDKRNGGGGASGARHRRRFSRSIAAALIAVGFGAPAALSPPAALPTAAQEQPLLMEGKRSLFQRIVARNAAPRRLSPAANARESGDFPALAPAFVYERRDADGERWLRVAEGPAGRDMFWLREADTIAWRQNIVLTFERHGELERMLFLETVDDVIDLVESERPGQVAAESRERARAAERDGGAAAPVLALGPRRSVDLSQNFYFLPITEVDPDGGYFESGGFAQILRVAVARSGAPDDGRPAPPPVDDDDVSAPQLRDYSAGVVFVMDTTISMGPYIRAARDVVMDMYDQLSRTRAGDNINFGLIGFRDSLEAAPRAGYLTRTFVPVTAGGSQRRFAEGVDEMSEATEPTRNFREDSLAGVQAAADDLRGSDANARWVILITDAGPRDFDERFSATRLRPGGLAQLAQEQGVYVAVLHLRTPQGAQDHDRAELRYRELTSVSNIGDLYFPVDGGDLSLFRAQAARLTSLMVGEIEEAMGERRTIAPPRAETPVDRQMADRVRAVSQAMRLRYLGSVTGERAPDVFEAWIADRDYERTGLKPVEIRLLLSKNQLSDLEEALAAIVRLGEEGMIEPERFFEQVVAAAADMSRRPDTVAARSDPTLAEATFVAEYLDGLPYKSRIMQITSDEWRRMNAAAQLELIAGLKEKLERYRSVDASPELWVDVTDSGAGAFVYAMPLDFLP